MKKTKPHILKRLLPFMGGKKRLLITSLALSSLSSVLNLLPFIFVWFIVHEIFSLQLKTSEIKFYAILAGLSIFASMIVYFLALTASHLAAFRAEVGLRKYAMKKITNMPLGYFHKHSSGKIRNIIDEGSSATHTFLAHQLPDLAATITTPIILLVTTFSINWQFGLVSLIPIALGFIAMGFMMSKEGEVFRKEYMNQLENMSSEAVEYVRGIPVVKTFGGSVHAFKRFTKSILKYKELVLSYTLLWNKPMAFYTVIVQSTAFFLVPFAVFYLSNKNLALTLTDFIFYLLITPNFSLIFMRSMHYKNHVSMTEQIMNKFDTVLCYEKMSYGNKKVPLRDLDLEFKNVSFSYKDRNKNAISNISFKVNSGECVALVGASGGGKSTIARLSARFWDVEEGEILIGGINIKNIPKITLSNSISFVFQNTKLFKKSIKENIILTKEHVTQEELDRAIKLSQSKEIVQKLKNGVNTTIGSRGVYLSGGEQQRIALARAFLKDAPIVILDEATAFTDPENEHLIQQALKDLRKGKTTLMIAHRLTSVMDADKILVVDDGKIIQRGNHKELLKEGGKYKKMWNEYQEGINWKIKDAQ